MYRCEISILTNIQQGILVNSVFSVYCPVTYHTGNCCLLGMYENA